MVKVFVKILCHHVDPDYSEERELLYRAARKEIAVSIQANGRTARSRAKREKSGCDVPLYQYERAVVEGRRDRKRARA